MSVNAGKREAGRNKADLEDGNEPLDENTSREDNEVRVTDRRRVNPRGEQSGRDEEDAASDEGTDEGANGADEVQMLKEKLMELEGRSLESERQVQEYSDRFRKAQAQMRVENDEFRARLQRNFEQRLDAARGDLVASLLETLDNLKRAVAAAEGSARRGADFAAFLDGVRATAELFEARMTALGLTAVESEGEEFNPELHEAVEIVTVAPEKDNRVVSQLQPGYRFGDRLLRPARVRVARATDG